MLIPGNDPGGRLGRGPLEFTVYIGNENTERPLLIARRMVEELHIGRAEFGVDALTGGCEVRIYHDPETLGRVRAYLQEKGILHDISVL